MKHIPFVLGSLILGVLTLLIVMSIHGKSLRLNEIETNLPNAVESTAENASITKKYPIANEDEYIADFVENFAYSITTNSDITINVMGENKDKGLLSVEAVETYQHPNGKEGTVNGNRTAIRNYVPLNDEYYTIRFYLSRDDLMNGTKSYKVYTVSSNETSLPCPAEPSMDGKTFAGWYTEYDDSADFSVVPTEDISFYAVWN